MSLASLSGFRNVEYLLGVKIQCKVGWSWPLARLMKIPLQSGIVSFASEVRREGLLRRWVDTGMFLRIRGGVPSWRDEVCSSMIDWKYSVRDACSGGGVTSLR